MHSKVERLGSARQQVIQEVLHYLIEHPDAKDTIKGILKWWIPREYLEQGEREVQEALDYLVMHGWLTTWPEHFQKDRKIYRVNKSRMDEIKELLGELEGQKY